MSEKGFEACWPARNRRRLSRHRLGKPHHTDAWERLVLIRAYMSENLISWSTLSQAGSSMIGLNIEGQGSRYGSG